MYVIDLAAGLILPLMLLALMIWAGQSWFSRRRVQARRVKSDPFFELEAQRMFELEAQSQRDRTPGGF